MKVKDKGLYLRASEIFEKNLLQPSPPPRMVSGVDLNWT